MDLWPLGARGLLPIVAMRYRLDLSNMLIAILNVGKEIKKSYSPRGSLGSNNQNLPPR